MVNKITIADIAKHAGVSKTSVSYVLSGKKRLSNEVEQRVMGAVETLGYAPPEHTARLIKKPPKIISLCLPIENGTISDDPYYIPLIEGAMDYAASQGYHLNILRLTKGDEVSQNLFYRSLEFVEGVILLNLYIDHGFEQALVDRNVPYVVNGTPDTIHTKYYVDVDIEGVGYQAATLLLGKGLRDIHYVNLGEHLLQSQQRLSGFRLAHKEFSLPWNEERHHFCNVTMDASYKLAMRILEQSNVPPQGFVTSNEIQAREMIKVLQEKHIAVPQQTAVVSMGGSILSVIGNPRITTVDFSPAKIGYESAKMLIEVITKRRIRPSHLIVPGKLIEREST